MTSALELRQISKIYGSGPAEVRALDAGSAAERLPLFGQSADRLSDGEPATRLPVMPPGQHVIHEMRTNQPDGRQRHQRLGVALRAAHHRLLVHDDPLVNRAAP